jgi:putative ABC transport system permease protein
MLKLALRNVLRHRLRTGITLMAIVFGVVGLILSGGFIQDLYFQLGESIIHSQSGHLQVAQEGFHAHGTRSPEKFLIDQPDSVQQRLLAQPQVDNVMGRINFSGLISNGRNDWPIVGEGVEPDKEIKLGTHVKIVEGRQLTQGDTFGVILGEGVAHALRLHPGGHTTLLLSTAGGALNSLEFEVIGTFQSFSKDYDDRTVRIPLSAAHELLGTQGVNSLVVSLKRTEDTRLVADALIRQLDSKQFEIKTWEQLNDFYASTVALYKRQFGVLQLIVLVMVLLSVANSVNMSVFERVGEFGTMMALGNRRSVVFRLVLTENALLGLCGGILGVVCGLILAWMISAVGIPMPPPPNANLGYIAHIRVGPSLLLTSFGIGFFATFLAALIPARRVSRIRVTNALMQNY